MASINARKLDHERHEVEFERFLQEIRKHDKWSTEEFLEYQRQQLCLLIRHAAKNVPYYRRIFSDMNINVDHFTDLQDLSKLPILEKKVVRENAESLIDETRKGDKFIIAHTSGTTGTPLNLSRELWFNSADYAFSEARWRVAAGMSRRRDRSVSIGVYEVTPQSRTKPPFWVYNRRWKQLYMSCYHLSPKYIGYYVDQLRRFKGDYIEGYPSSIYAVAKYILDNNLEQISFKACFTTAETLFDHYREAFKKAFGCRTFDQYGCNEFVVFAAECSTGSMHLSPEVGIVEVVDDNDQPVPVGQVGQLICTGLMNKVQPLIRYRVGDFGALKAGRCLCGSSLPMIQSIEGRTDAIVITRDGRHICRFDPVFKGVSGIREAQIVQDDYEKFRIRVVPGKTYSTMDGDKIMNNLAQRVGEAEIRVELVDEIERTKSGKFKAVVCNLPKQ